MGVGILQVEIMLTFFTGFYQSGCYVDSLPIIARRCVCSLPIITPRTPCPFSFVFKIAAGLQTYLHQIYGVINKTKK
jgi:hypothetical protein